MLQRLFTPCAGSSNPHPSTVHYPLSLASPAAAVASFTGMQVKICFFFSFLFIPFLTNVTETLYPMHWVLKPLPLHHIIPTSVLCPQASQVLPPPLPAFAGMQVKISFFLLFLFLF